MRGVAVRFPQMHVHTNTYYTHKSSKTHKKVLEQIYSTEWFGGCTINTIPGKFIHQAKKG